MRRDLIKTALGVVLVGLVVVATFLYGNHQTQVQKQKEQTLQEQRRKEATTQNTQKQSNTTRPASKATAPVAQTPSTQKPTAVASQPPATKTPQTGASNALPQTGGIASVLPLLFMIGAGRLYWRSRHWASDNPS